jgi:putative membrane protein
MMKTIAFAGALLLSTAAYAQTAAPASATGAQLSAGDEKFINTIGSAGLSEVQEAQLAQQKSDSPKVKEFAQRMITDHTANNQQLAAVAQRVGYTAPTSPDAKDQKQLDHLQKLSGAKFDRAYMSGQVRDHEMVLKLLQKEVSDGQNADVKAFAQQTIPVIQQHLDLAKSDTTS